MKCSIIAATITAALCFARAFAEEPLSPETRAVLRTALEKISQIKDLQGSVFVKEAGAASRDATMARISVLEEMTRLGLPAGESIERQIERLRAQLKEEPRETVYPRTEWRMHREGAYRVLTVGPDGSVLNAKTFNGKVAAEYTARENRGYIFTKPDEPYPGLRLPLAIAPGQGVLETFERAERSGSITFSAGEGDLSGTVRFTAMGPGRPERILRVWFDPRRGYSIQRQELGVASGKDFLIELAFVALEVKQITESIWLPVAGKVESHQVVNVMDPGKPPEKWPLKSFPCTHHYRFEFKDVVVNAGLAPDKFAFEFPDRTKVSDTREGTVQPLGK